MRAQRSTTCKVREGYNRQQTRRCADAVSVFFLSFLLLRANWVGGVVGMQLLAVRHHTVTLEPEADEPRCLHHFKLKFPLISVTRALG